MVRRRGSFQTSAVSGLPIDRALGYRALAVDDLPGTQDIVQRCRELYEAKQELHTAAGRDMQSGADPTQHHILIDLLDDGLLQEERVLVDFALHERILNTVTRYLGQLPVLRRVGLLLSRSPLALEDSALLHKDPEDLEQVKLFLNIFTVSNQEGPFTFLPANVSRQVLQGIHATDRGPRRHRRYTDTEALRFCRPADFIRLTGPPGSAVLVDTSRCLHFGSRVDAGHFRLVYYAQFCRFHQRVLTSVNNFDRQRYSADDIRWHVLTPKRRRGRRVVSARPVH